jgi:hypothetical protein
MQSEQISELLEQQESLATQHLTEFLNFTQRTNYFENPITIEIIQAFRDRLEENNNINRSPSQPQLPSQPQQQSQPQLNSGYARNYFFS